MITFSWSPSGNAIYFERGFRGARNIWKMRVDPETLRATGVDRLTRAWIRCRTRGFKQWAMDGLHRTVAADPILALRV